MQKILKPVFKRFLLLAFALSILSILGACGSGDGSTTAIGPGIPGSWQMTAADVENELRNNNIAFNNNNFGSKIMITTGGANGPHDLIYVFESDRLTQVIQANTVTARDENNFMDQAKVFETEVLAHWNNRYEAMDKNLQPVRNALKSFQSIAHDGKKYATFMYIWFDNKTAQFTVQYINPDINEGNVLWDHYERSDPGFVKR